MARRQLEVCAEIFLIPDFLDGDAFGELARDFVFQMPGYQPQIWGVDRSAMAKLSLIELRELARQGSAVLHWKRNVSPKGEGSLSKRFDTPTGAEHAVHRLRISVKDDEQMDWLIGYVCYCAASDGVDFAHCYAEGQSNGLGDSKNPDARITTSLSTQNLRTVLPDISWGQVFGRAYVDIFGLDKLLSSPAYLVEQLTPDAVYVQLTESVFDTINKPMELHARKQLVKRHLDNNVFLDPTCPPSHVYRTPLFDGFRNRN
ncbi:hypothetical protein ACXIUT_04965 [Achromobacter denitrificans]